MDLFEFQASQLARAAADVADYLAGLKVDLYQSPIDINQSTPVGTFTAAVCTYTGYAQAAVTWQDPSVADDGTVEVTSDAITFRPTDAVAPNVAWGVFMRAAVGGALLFAGQFDEAPLPMQSALDQITLVVRYRPASNSLVAVIS